MAGADDPFHQMAASGATPQEVAEAILFAGRSQTDCLRILRAIYHFDLAEAKRAMQSAQGVDPDALAKSLIESLNELDREESRVSSMRDKPS